MIKYDDNFIDYQLLSCGSGVKIERFGKYILKRPDPQAIWKLNNNNIKINAVYHRSNKGGGSWEIFDLPDNWNIKYNFNDKCIRFILKPYTFKHTGIFPEQSVNWNYIYKKIIDSNKKDFKVLNLFAYTGGATMVASLANAKVVHVDSSKGIINYAKENYKLSNLNINNVRFIIDDCKKFVKREQRRQNVYDAIILDPPSYGRGANNEIWKLEDDIYDFLNDLVLLLNNNSNFVLFNSYTTGLQEGVISYLLQDTIAKKFGGKVITYELGLKSNENNLILPQGITGIWQR